MTCSYKRCFLDGDEQELKLKVVVYLDKELMQSHCRNITALFSIIDLKRMQVLKQIILPAL